MATLTIIVPDDIAVMALFNFAADNGLRGYWKDSKTMEMRPIPRTVIDFRQRGAGVVADRDPEPPRAA